MKLKKFREIIDNFSLKLKSEIGENVTSLYLFGSVIIQEDFHFGISDINTFIIFKDESSNDVISKTSEVYRKYSKYPFSIPLMLKESEVLEAKDVFPVEFIEIKEKNILLYGEDFLKDIELKLADIRKQCESEIRAKIIGLRKMLFSKDELVRNQEIIYKSLTSSIILLKQVLRLRNEPIPNSRAEIIDSLESHFNTKFNGLKSLYGMREHQVRITKNIIERLILDYISDLEFFSKVLNEEV